MGHCCEILTFDGATSKAEMQAEVNDWFYNNYDRLEGPCPSFAINWSRGNMVFDGEKAVKDYLNKTFGNYDQYAVQYHPEVKSEPSATYKRLVDRCNNEINKLGKAIFNAYHYLDGISSKYITCKDCGSKLNREVMVKSLSEWYTEKIITNDVRDKVRTAMNSNSKFDELSVQRLIRAATNFNSCPVCHACYLPKTTLSSLESKATKIIELEKKVVEERNSNKKYDQKKLMWAVAAECHC